MKCSFWASVLLVLSIISYASADMYIWVDENGVKHYTDRAPDAGEVSPEKVTQAETVKYEFDHPLYSKSGDQEYCGNDELPRLKKNDSEQYLRDVKNARRHAYNNRKMLANNLEADTSDSGNQISRRYIYQNECIMEWADSIIKNLESAKP